MRSRTALLKSAPTTFSRKKNSIEPCEIKESELFEWRLLIPIHRLGYLTAVLSVKLVARRRAAAIDSSLKKKKRKRERRRRRK